MSRFGIRSADVADRIFNCFSNRRQGVSVYQAILPYKSAVMALCVLGVGGREKQAEAVFRCCDEDRSRTLSRTELLRFVTDNRPEQTEDRDKRRQRVDCFRKVT